MSLPPASLGRYELVELLGRGGMAEVWRARMLGPAGFERQIAVKRILPVYGEDPELIALFLREATISARFSHGNVVQVYELGEADGSYFLTMEYVHGQNLGALLRELSRREQPAPPGLAAYVGREVCRALDYVHGLTDADGRPLGLLHRDVSPSNVMLAYDGTVKLVDFGIARAMAVLAQRFTRVSEVRGKLAYMAPERIEAGTVDHRSDQFSVGVVVHETLTLRRLFRGANEEEVMRNVVAGNVDRPSMFNADVGPALDDASLRALAPVPDDRFPSCGAFAAALDAAAHEHRFGPTQLAALLREVLPPRPAVGAPTPTLLTLSPVRPPQVPDPRTSTGTLTPPPRRRSGLVVLGAAALALAVGVGIGLRTGAKQRGHRPPVVPATAPAPPAPEPATAPAPVTPVAAPGVALPLDDERALAPTGPRIAPPRRTRALRAGATTAGSTTAPSRVRPPQRDLKTGTDVVDPFE